MAPEHPGIAHRDWRLHAVTTTTTPFRSPNTGFEHPAGTVIELAGFLTHCDEMFAVPVADAAAMFLSLAMAASRRGRQAAAILQELPPTTSAARNAISVRQVDDHDETRYFDALQDLVAAVVFTYSGIEAFANQLLPPEYRYRRERQDGRCTEEYDRGQVERNLSLDYKLDAILPALRTVASPKGSALWQRFVRLERLRNRLIHLKRDDWRNLQPADAPTSIWSDLMAPDVPSLYRVAVEFALHFTPVDRPRWITLAQQKMLEDVV